MRYLSGFVLIGALFAATASTPAAARHVDVIVEVAPPESRYERAPRAWRGHVWVPGYWAWNGHRHRWHAGYWVEERRGWRYKNPRWENDNGRWRYYGGRWER